MVYQSSSKVWIFSPQVFHQSFGGNVIIFGAWVEINLTNRNPVDIPIDAIELEVPVSKLKMHWNKEEVGIFFRWMNSFCQKMSFTDISLINHSCWRNPHTRLLPYSKICHLELVLSPTPIYLDLRTNSVALKVGDQHVPNTRTNPTFWY